MSSKIRLGISIVFAALLALDKNPNHWFLIATAALYAGKSIQIYFYERDEEQHMGEQHD